MKTKTERLESTFALGIALALAIFRGGTDMSIVDNGDSFRCDAALSPWAFISFGVALFLYARAAVCRVENRGPSQPAGLGRRAVATLLDLAISSLIVVPLLTASWLILEAHRVGAFSWEVHRTTRAPSDHWMPVLVLAGMLLAVLLLAWPLRHGHRSIGLVITGMTIEAERPLSMSKAVLRMCLGWLTLAASAVSGPMAWSRKDKRMWHDLAFGTRAVLTTDETSVAGQPASRSRLANQQRH